MLLQFEAEMLAVKLLQEVGRNKWCYRTWETPSNGWRYAIESKDGWWLITPNFVEGEIDGYAAYLRATPNHNLSARWMEVGLTPIGAMSNTAHAVYQESEAISRASRGCQVALRAVITHQDESPENHPS